MTCDPDALDPTIEVHLSRPGEEGDLIIGPDCVDEQGLWWSSIVLPQWTYRYTQAPPSAWVPGNVLLAAVVESASLVMSVAALGTDQVTLNAQKAVLADTVAQWPYYVTVLIGGTTLGTWKADPTIPQWPIPLAQQDAGLYVDEAIVTIPLNPVGAP